MTTKQYSSAEIGRMGVSIITKVVGFVLGIVFFGGLGYAAVTGDEMWLYFAAAVAGIYMLDYGTKAVGMAIRHENLEKAVQNVVSMVKTCVSAGVIVVGIFTGVTAWHVLGVIAGMWVISALLTLVRATVLGAGG